MLAIHFLGRRNVRRQVMSASFTCSTYDPRHTTHDTRRLMLWIHVKTQVRVHSDEDRTQVESRLGGGMMVPPRVPLLRQFCHLLRVL